MYWEEIINKVKNNIGKNVTILYNKMGRLETYQRKLCKVTDTGVFLEAVYLPFMGYGSYIETILLTKNRKVIYENPSFEKTDKKASENFERQALKLYEDENERQEAIDCAMSRLKGPYLAKKGLPYVKEELKEAWESYVEMKTINPTSCAILEMSIRVMEAISNGADKVAIDEMLVINGFDVNMYIDIMRTIKYFTNLIKEDTKNPAPTLSK